MRVLFPLDGSAVAEAALGHAKALGDAFDAEMLLLQVIPTHAVERGPITNLVDWQLRRCRAEDYLADVATRLRGQGLRVATAVEEGRTTEEVLRLVARHEVSLVVLTESGAGESGPGRLGGTAGKIIAGLDASVMLVPQPLPEIPSESEAYRLVVAPVDGSPGSAWAARVGAAIAMASKAMLLLVRVVRSTELPGSAGYSRETRHLAERLTQAARVEAGHWLRLLRSQLPAELDVETMVVVASSVSRIVREIVQARCPDLLVISAHGFDHELDWRYGPVAERLLLHSACPILVLQHDPAVAAGAGWLEDSGRWRMRSLA
jgi:nucleotide-binding universal stress UspA family protein